MIERIKKNIDVSLSNFLKCIKHEYQLHLVNPILFKSIQDFTLRRGKRIRPLLLILSYKGYSKNKVALSQKLYTASICIEFLHNFMLIHDDIIDRSDLRRGKPTMHRLLGKAVKTKNKERLGYDLSIVAGDIVYAMAVDAFLSIDEAPRRKEAALKYFIQTAAFTAIGEFIDITHGVDKIANVTEKDVFLNYTLKTARYTFSCPLVMGAILAGANQNDIRKLSRLGILTGQAFQIQDDILGVFGSEKTIGKSVLSDIEEFKKTILICHAYRKLSPKRRAVFMRYFSKTKKSYHDLAVIREFLVESQSLAYSLKKMESLLGQARIILSHVKMKDPYRKLIADLLQSFFKSSDEIAQANGIGYRIL